MSRIFFQRAPAGFRSVQGELIRVVQVELAKAGHYMHIVDSSYGPRTEVALIAYQTANGLPASGKIDTATWTKLISPTLPDLRSRCLQVTADFEGTGFQKIVGNFDGAGLTWGIIGFTLKHGELLSILKEVQSKHAAVFESSFGSLTGKIAEFIKATPAKQMDFANAISVGTSKTKVLEEWAVAFDKLGSEKVVQDIQLVRTKKYFDIADRDVQRLGLKTELGLALCFDIAVQNGGIDSSEVNLIKSKMEQNPPTTEMDLRTIIANVVAENSLPQYVENVRKRKLTFATGSGLVHGSNYSVKVWGLDEVQMISF